MLNVSRFLARLALTVAAVSAIVGLCATPVLRAQSPGRVEPTFNPGVSAVALPDGTPVFGGTIRTIVPPTVVTTTTANGTPTTTTTGDGVVVGGDFTSALGAAGTGGQRNFFARYSNTGMLDSTFNSTQLGGPDGPVLAAVPSIPFSSSVGASTGSGI